MKKTKMNYSYFSLKPYHYQRLESMMPRNVRITLRIFLKATEFVKALSRISADRKR